MIKDRIVPVLTLVLVLLVSSCSFASPFAARTPPATNPLEQGTSPEPAAEATFEVIPPAGTDQDASLELELLDPVTGLDYNAYRVPLDRLDNGHYQATLTPQVGSLLTYRYIRTSPASAIEVSTSFEPVHTRTAYIPGPIHLTDIIAGWSDQPYSGPTGRILGQVSDALTGEPLVDRVITAGGLTTYSDGQGFFRLDGLAPGMHHITVFSPSGSHVPVQQGAIIAGDASTPVELSMQPAAPVQVTFELTVPADTPAEASVRIAGNIMQLGNRFTDLSGGMRTSITHMPEMVRVDPSHFLAILQLFEGTDLHYKYTLGDGFWNAERGDQGAFVTRQVVLQGREPILRDEVQSWSVDGGPALHFDLSIPGSTPPGEGVALQFKPGQWFTPLAMWPVGGDRYEYDLFAPLSFEGEVGYRYCRSLACGSADDHDTAGIDPAGRPAPDPAAGATLQDQVESWQWFESELDPGQVVAVPASPRSGFEAGIDLLPNYRLDWERSMPGALDDIAASNASLVTFSPRWQVSQLNPFPLFTLNPAQAPFDTELKNWIDLAHQKGLQVALRPGLALDGAEGEAFWRAGVRDLAWWKIWFEGYRAMLLSYARLAAAAGAEQVVIDLHSIAAALPAGTLPDGSPSGVPGDSENSWRTLISELQELYPGLLIGEIEIGAESQTPPPFLDQFDRVRLYWHAPLTDDAAISFDQLQEQTRILLEASLANRALAQIPVVLSVEYLSVQDSELACPPAPDGRCRPASDFIQGAVVDPDLGVDLQAQAWAVNALLLAAQSQPQLGGVSVRGYDPGPVLHDKSASVRGKPAEDIVRYWFAQLVP
jgi:hypothetical protein